MWSPESVRASWKDYWQSEASSERRAWLKEARRKDEIRARTLKFFKLTGLVRLACVCGRPDGHMHHPDYDKPLEVAFLCPKCHRHEHLGRLSTPFETHDLRWLAVADTVAFV
jgi:hypothetical protein